MGQIKYMPSTKAKNSGPEAVLAMCMVNDYLIIATVLDNYYVELNDDELFDSIDYEDRR